MVASRSVLLSDEEALAGGTTISCETTDEYAHQYHPEGNYYLRLSAGKGSWRKIGPKAADAVRAAEYEESLLSAKASGTIG